MKTRSFLAPTVALLLVGCAGKQVAQPSSPVQSAARAAAVGGAISACAPLKTFQFANTAIESAEEVKAGGLMLAGKPVEAHCVVKGAMHKRKSADGKDWAIGFEMRLPNAWNGRYYYQGNGGLDGTVHPALGQLGGGPLTHALAQGFAVISSDAGHTGAQTTQFGFELQSRLDYGYQAVQKLTPMAKSLVKVAYGKSPDYSYIGGCSNGGRHAMVAAARIPEQYDGYIVGAPGFRLPNAAVAQMWGAQQFAKLSVPGALTKAMGRDVPDLSAALTAAQRTTVANAIIARCDMLDGAKDGVVNDIAQCQRQFDVSRDVLTCAGAQTEFCVPSAQKSLLADLHSGAKTKDGRTIYAPFWWDTGIANANWAQWKQINSVALDPLAVGVVFNPEPAFIRDPLTANVDDFFARIHAKNDKFPESALIFMSPPDATNLSALQKRGAKMLVYHGVSDPIFSAADTADWFANATAKNTNVQDTARVFMMPGWAHCSAGAAADQVDLLTPTVNWVEKGIAPAHIVAAVRGAGNAGGANPEIPASWNASRTARLCPYPSVARYNGIGDIENAASFSCK